MTLTHILVFVAAALLYIALLPERWRTWALFVGSVVAIYWLQPEIRIRALDFVFPTATLGLVALSWLISRAPDQCWTREDSVAAGTAAGLVLLLSLGRYLVPSYRLTPSIPPAPIRVALGLAGVLVILVAITRLPVKPGSLALPTVLLILAVFAVLKTQPLAREASRWLRAWQGQPKSLASATELEWLGFSYVAFRLIHTLRDRQTGKLPSLSLREYTTYVIFFPAFTAGPIDRAERFLPELRALPGPDPSRFVQGGMRIAAGIGKKFVIADSLAYMALSATTAHQANSVGGLWVLLYAYAFRIYFDFSGYSDIAIGIGQLFGIKLPENFSQPYLKRNITQFWQSWHTTLSQWVRFYVFSPLTRYLLTRDHKPSPMILALIGQLATMLAIGLWHGVTWGFAAWGVWHGVGLFIHKVWSDHTRLYYLKLRERPRLGQALGVAGTLLTFHFVVLGWVWFALPDIGTSWDVFGRLFGM
ncbi:MAG TPA: MBOAT family O-acyltransferase [Aggregatilineaceae bacterium]|jgi:alginate O-acetyltransferase complex protein AlgI|nr:MBOAT family O-acyltransferase [Aggregatilineaceae bacterium]